MTKATLALVIGTVVALATLAVVGRYRHGHWRQLRRWMPQRTVAPQTDLFVGRQEELRKFSEQLELAAAEEPAARLILVTGPPGIGKTELLRQLQKKAHESQIPHTSVLRLRDCSSELAVMREIAVSLSGSSDGAFASFLKETDRAHGDSEDSRLEIAHGTATDLAVAGGQVGVPLAKPTQTLLESETFHRAVTYASYKPTPTDRTALFLKELARVASTDSRPTVVLISDVGSVASDRPTHWLLDGLLPRMGSLPVMVVLASANDLRLPRELPRSPLRWPIGPLSPADVRDYGRAALELQGEYALTELVRVVDGLPIRLAALRTYFEANEHERGELTAEAIKFALGQALVKLPMAGTPTLRVVLALAACRSFNVTLVERIASCTVGLDADQANDVINELLDPSRRPPFVVETTSGWSLGNERLGVLDRWQRIDPSGVRNVHETAALYYFGRLRSMEGEGLSEGSREAEREAMAGYRPCLTQDRLTDDAFVASLSEFLYHLLALDPTSFFATYVDAVAQAICFDPSDVVARQLLDLDGAVSLTPRQRALVNQLRIAAQAAQRHHWSECSGALSGAIALGCPTGLSTAALHFASGFALWQSGLMARSEAAFRRSMDLLESEHPGDSDAGESRFGVTLRAWVRPWWIRAAREIGLKSEDVDQVALTVVKEAKALKDPMLLAEAYRAQGVLQSTEEPDAAESNYNRALDLVTRASRQDATVGIRVDLADLYLDRGDLAKATEQLDAAEELALVLQDMSNLTSIRTTRLRLALKSGIDDPSPFLQAVLDLRPGSADLLNELANCLYLADKFDDAIAYYLRAIATVPEPVYYANLARAEVARANSADIINAEEHYRESIKLAPGDPDAQVDLARHLHSWGRDAEAQALARTAAEGALGATRSSDGSSTSFAASHEGLSRYFYEALDLCSPNDCVDLLEAASRRPHSNAVTLRELARRLNELLTSEPGEMRAPHVIDRLSAALVNLDKMLEPTDPARLEYLPSLIRLEMDRGRLENAQRWLSEATKLGGHEHRVDGLGSRLAALTSNLLAGTSTTLAASLRVFISNDLVPWADPHNPVGAELYSRYIDGVLRPAFTERWGIVIPGVRIAVDPALSSGIRVEFQGEAAATVALDSTLLASGSAPDLARIARSAKMASVPWTDEPLSWVDESDEGLFSEAGVTMWDPRGALCCALASVLDSRIHQLAQIVFANDEAMPSTGVAEPVSFLRVRTAAVGRSLLKHRRPVHDVSRIRQELLDHPEIDVPSAAEALLDSWDSEVESPVTALFARFAEVSHVNEGRLVLRFEPADEEGLSTEALGGADAVLKEAASWFGLPAPASMIRRPSRSVSPGTFELWRGETRLATGEWGATSLDWWLAHPELGSPELWSPFLGDVRSANPSRLVLSQLLEEPAILCDLVDENGRSLLADAQPSAADDEWWHDVVRCLLRGRMPLPAASVFGAQAHALVGESPKWAAAKLADDLRVLEVALVLSPSLDERDGLGDEASARYKEVAASFFEDFGVDVPMILSLESDDSLPDRSFVIRVNGLRRTAGRLGSPGTRAVPVGDSGLRHDDEPWVHPVAGDLHAWRGAVDVGLEAPDALIIHMASCVREALTEFADIGWLRRHMRRIEESDPSAFDALSQISESVRFEIMTGLLSTGLSARSPWVLIPMLETYVESLQRSSALSPDPPMSVGG